MAPSPLQVARAEGNGAKKHTTMMTPATLALAFLETKIRAAQASLFEELVSCVQTRGAPQATSEGTQTREQCAPSGVPDNAAGHGPPQEPPFVPATPSSGELGDAPAVAPGTATSNELTGVDASACP